MTTVDVDFKKIRDVICGIILVVGSACWLWFGVRTCSGPWTERVCVFADGWPMYGGWAAHAFGWYLLAGDKFREFGSTISAMRNGAKVRASTSTDAQADHDDQAGKG